MRASLVSLLAAALLFCAAAAAAGAAGQPGEALALSANRVKLNIEALDQERVGRLIWRGGLHLRSPDPRFGGLSGLWMSPQADRLFAVSDEGHWVSFPVTHAPDGDLEGIGDGRIGRLLDPDGRDLGGEKDWGDAEALLVLPDGDLLVSFERKHRLNRYARVPPEGRSQPVAAPPGQTPDANEGVESLARLPDGRIVALSEGRTAEIGGATVWHGAITAAAYAEDVAPDWQPLYLPREGDLAPVDARVGPEGAWLYWLERAWSALGGMRVKLKRTPVAALAPGALIAPQELAFLKAPLTVDNLEGLWLRRGPAGETLITLISDDNFHDLQRTLLLQFELVE